MEYEIPPVVVDNLEALQEELIPLVGDRQIWIFREPRSGSTAFTEGIRYLTGRGSVIVEPNDKISYDLSVVYSTHYFGLLNSLKKEDNPIIFRCTRKNRLEQFLSVHTMLATNFSNIRTNHPNSKLQYNPDEVLQFQSYIKKNKVTIQYQDVVRFKLQKKRENSLWDDVAYNFDNQIFYYENLNNLIDIPILNLYNINLNAEQYTKKIPDYKEQLYTNLNEVKKWMTELESF